MARIHLLNRVSRFRLVWSLLLASISFAHAQPPQIGSADLIRINTALARWLALASTDVPYVVIDHEAEEVRLYHHSALLRICGAELSGLQALGDSLMVTAHLRRLRPSGPYTPRSAGPFDWERYLADAATPHSALLLTGDVLIYSDGSQASSAWGKPPGVRLHIGDLCALSDAVTDETPVVYLPRGWSQGESKP